MDLLTPKDRMHYHLQQFMKAAQEHDPRIIDWKIWDYSALRESGPGAWMIVASREKLPRDRASTLPRE